jgi:hypothetical protein
MEKSLAITGEDQRSEHQSKGRERKREENKGGGRES